MSLLSSMCQWYKARWYMLVVKTGWMDVSKNDLISSAMALYLMFSRPSPPNFRGL